MFGIKKPIKMDSEWISYGIVILSIIIFSSIINKWIVNGLYTTKKEQENQLKKRKEQEERYKKHQIQKLIEQEAAQKAKLKAKKLRYHELNESSQIVGKTIDKAFKTTSKIIIDSTQKIKKNINLSISKHYITSISWLKIELNNNYTLFTFKSNNELIITKNGNVDKGSYELLQQNKSILITQRGVTEHYNFVNINNDYFFLNKVSTKNVYAFVNQDRYNGKSRDWFIKECDQFKKKLT